MSTDLAVPFTNIAVPEPRSVEPTGVPSWPRMLISGEEGALKSTTLAAMSADERLGGMFWLEVGRGESTAHEYGKIEVAGRRVNYRIIEHDGKFSTILGQLVAHWKLAKQAELNGEPPIALGMDSMSGIWQMICQWLDLVARRREIAKCKKQNKPVPKDLWSPDYEPNITPDLWTLGNKRHDMILDVALRWPGPAGYTAREKQVTVFKDNGQPDPYADKIWTLEAQKMLGFNSSVWVRLTRGGKPQLVKLRTVKRGLIEEFVRASDKRVVLWKGGREDTVSLPELVFDVVGCEAGVSTAPDIKDFDADETLPGEEIPDVPDEPAAAPRGNGRQYDRGRRQEQPAVVEGSTTAPRTDGAKVAAAVTYLFAAAKNGPITRKIMQDRAVWATSDKCDVRNAEASGLLTAEQRTTLGLGSQEPATVAQIAGRSLAATTLAELLDLADVDAVAQLHTWIQGAGPLRMADVRPLLTEDDIDRIGLAPADVASLDRVGELAVRYVGKHKRSVRSPLEDEAPAAVQAEAVTS